MLAPELKSGNAGWPTYRFGDIATLINGRAYKQHELLPSGQYQVIRIQNLNGGKNWYFSDLTLEENKYCIDGDLLFAWSATFGPYVWRGDKAIFHYHIWNVQPNFELLDKGFAYFLLLWITEEIRAGAHGIAMLHFTKEGMENFEVQIPNLAEQRQIAARLKAQLAEVDKARQAAEVQLRETTKLADAIVFDSIRSGKTTKHNLGEVLEEFKQGIGESWADYPVLGATRDGLAPAKEPPGKKPERYKPVFPGTVFYNPMRILIGSIALVDDDDTPGITSPDYVALRGKKGVVDSSWFYYWLRSPLGEQCILSLARGAVRERMLFNRLADGEIELPDFTIQQNASSALAALRPMRQAIESKINDINLLPQKILAQAFGI